MKPGERYCMRIFHGFCDQRDFYDPDFDINSDLSDDADNFKIDKDRCEDVEIFNHAFCDRISRIWQSREEYFHYDTDVIDWFDSFSNLAFQMHMVEFYKESLKHMLDYEYDELQIDELMQYVKSCYTDIIACKDPKMRPDLDEVVKSTEGFDRLSEMLYEIGQNLGMPF